MKQAMIGFCLGVAACNSNGGSSSNAEGGDTRSTELAAEAEAAEAISPMLKEGRPEACAHPAVKAKLFTDMEAEVAKQSAADFSASGVTEEDMQKATEIVGEPIMTDFQALEADVSVGALACGVHIQVGQSGEPVFITYILRPSLENEDHFLIAFPRGGPNLMWRMAIAGQAVRLADARKPEEPEPEPQTAEDVQGM